ncbi:MAG: hypothetical protein L0332_13620 [Chloroflexi bacterium]|nr:hypothetical protein [Chloroflexota bacterium]MCI0581131.1 hypothetical protein [Chloroflexota bacterium]MCI0649981.1 hypothetical protein [Chloroflexota bacterium]MCI0727743.1 hypothetical protein [Chloroflexota bacterium]
MAEPLPELIQRLAALPPYEEPLAALWQQLGARRLTLRLVHEHWQLLDQYAGERDDETNGRLKVIRRCQKLTPIPLPHLPLGF